MRKRKRKKKRVTTPSVCLPFCLLKINPYCQLLETLTWYKKNVFIPYLNFILNTVNGTMKEWAADGVSEERGWQFFNIGKIVSNEVRWKCNDLTWIVNCFFAPFSFYFLSLLNNWPKNSSMSEIETTSRLSFFRYRLKNSSAFSNLMDIKELIGKKWF